MIQVLIVDDHQLMRQGIAALLIKAKDIKIIGEARDGQEAVEMATDLKPDVILMDIEMPRLDGLRATTQLAAAGSPAKVVILSMRTDEASAREAFASGALGYLVKNANRDELVAGIRSAYQGERVVSPSMAPYFTSLTSAGA